MDSTNGPNPTLGAALREAGRKFKAAYAEGLAKAKAERAAKQAAAPPSEGLRTALHGLALRLAEATKPEDAPTPTVINNSIVMQPQPDVKAMQQVVERAFQQFAHELNLRHHA